MSITSHTFVCKGMDDKAGSDLCTSFSAFVLSVTDWQKRCKENDDILQKELKQCKGKLQNLQEQINCLTANPCICSCQLHSVGNLDELSVEFTDLALSDNTPRAAEKVTMDKVRS